MIGRGGSCRAWLELVRPPNLPTVPGDALAGFALAALGQAQARWTAVLPAAGAAVLLYAAGLIWNDCADLREDRASRPRRPLPSGRVSPRRAAWAGAAAAAAGIGLAAMGGRWVLAGAVALLGLIAAYDFGARRVRALSALNMGACRAMSVLMGAGAAWAQGGRAAGAAAGGAAGIWMYVAAVSWIAARETCSEPVGRARWAPGLAAALAIALAAAAGANLWARAPLCAAPAVAPAAAWGARLGGSPGPDGVGRAVGGLIRVLIPLQAGLCAMGGGRGGVTAAAVLLLAAWPLSAALSRRFAGS
ncbi:MAG: prenyltransferase [Lentisphaerae bacterium]|nr:prenyltransferase [Lentisphaerota bacterium]